MSLNADARSAGSAPHHPALHSVFKVCCHMRLLFGNNTPGTEVHPLAAGTSLGVICFMGPFGSSNTLACSSRAMKQM